MKIIIRAITKIIITFYIVKLLFISTKPTLILIFFLLITINTFLLIYYPFHLLAKLFFKVESVNVIIGLI